MPLWISTGDDYSSERKYYWGNAPNGMLEYWNIGKMGTDFLIV
jgi:hypothetical protein